MRQSRVFAASPGALQRNMKKVHDQKVSVMRQQIGACQALIVKGVDVQSNQQWVRLLEICIRNLKG